MIRLPRRLQPKEVAGNGWLNTLLDALEKMHPRESPTVRPEIAEDGTRLHVKGMIGGGSATRLEFLARKESLNTIKITSGYHHYAGASPTAAAEKTFTASGTTGDYVLYARFYSKLHASGPGWDVASGHVVQQAASGSVPANSATELVLAILRYHWDNTAGVIDTISPQSHVGSLFVTDPADGYPSGIIAMFSGATIPTGWSLCDGTNDGEGNPTPDMRALFVVGHKTGDADFGTVGATGGEKNIDVHHKHVMPLADNDEGTGTDTVPSGTESGVIHGWDGTGNAPTQLEGDNDTDDKLDWDGDGRTPTRTDTNSLVKILPPFYVTKYIRKD